MLQKAPITTKLNDSVQNPKKFTSAATGYGSANKRVARNKYRKQTKNHVHECGFIVNPKFPCIGATPDSKVCDNGQSGILEIKCPLSVHNGKIADAVNRHNPKPDFFLQMIGENL